MKKLSAFVVIVIFGLVYGTSAAFTDEGAGQRPDNFPMQQSSSEQVLLQLYPRVGDDPSLLYNSCKKSLSDKSFEQSICRIAISSIIMGAVHVSAATLPIDRPTDPYQLGQYDAAQRIGEKLCVPKDQDLKEIAMDYINWFEGKWGYKSPEMLKDTGEYGLAGVMFAKYSCHAIKEKKDGLHNSGK